MVLQMYKWAPRKAYSSWASCTCQIYIYRDIMIEFLPLKNCAMMVRSLYQANIYPTDEQSQQTTYYNTNCSDLKYKHTSNIYKRCTTWKVLNGTWGAKTCIWTFNIFVGANRTLLKMHCIRKYIKDSAINNLIKQSVHLAEGKIKKMQGFKSRRIKKQTGAVVVSC